MDFKTFLQVLQRRWRTIVVVFVVALGLGGLITWQTTPTYESSSRVFVSINLSNSNDTASYSGAVFLTTQIQTYAELATSEQLLSYVIDQLNLPMTTDQLAGEISASVVAQTTIIEITVRDSIPERAQAIGRLESQGLATYLERIQDPNGDASTQVVAKVTDPASLDATQVSPRTALNLVAAGLIGLLLGLALALARNLLDRRVTSLDHVQALTGSPVLASVGYDKTIEKQPLLSDINGFAARTEAFRVLRTNLQFLDLEHQPRSLVVTSAMSGEGKTFTSTNLAVALAQAGRKVLIVDGDLRRPKVAAALGMDGATGLTTVLLGNVELDDAVQVHEASGLHLLASGGRPPNPTEILQSRLTRDLLAQLTARYDLVLIDAPPLLPVADAAVLSAAADGTLLVVHHGKTTRDQVAEAISRLDQVSATLSGIVMNMIPKKSSSNYYYYYAS